MKKNKILLFVLFIVIILFIPIDKVYADDIDGHSSYYLKPLINESSLKYEFTIFNHNENWGALQEKKDGVNWLKIFKTYPNTYDYATVGDYTYKFEQKFKQEKEKEIQEATDAGKPQSVIDAIQERELDYSEVVKSYNNTYNKNITKDDIDKWESFKKSKPNDDSGLFFSFPAYKKKDSSFFNNILGGDDATTNFDNERANVIGSRLTNSLNSLISVIDDLDSKKNISSVNALIDSVNILAPSDILNYMNAKKIPSGDINSDFFVQKIFDDIYVYYSKVSTTEDNVYSDSSGNMYAYIMKIGKDDINEASLKEHNIGKIIWAMPKGYLNVDGTLFSDGDKVFIDGLSITKIRENTDPGIINMFHIASFANYYYTTFSITNKTVQTETPNLIVRTLSDIFGTLVLDLQRILGLDSIYDLIYNGNGASSSYTSNLMNNSWWSIMTKYHLIFQVIAWMLIGLALAKIIVELNLSTINPRVRMSIMETIQKLLVVGFLLVLCIPVIKMMAEFNNSIVSIFATQAQSDKDAFTIGASLAQIFAYAMYFGILCILNCTYIMRSIMIAILGASAPLFIISIIFTNGKSIFSSWIKEISANIFMQSVHAFAFAFLFEVLDTGGWLSKLVILFSLMPITETFRNLIFQDAGKFTTSQGSQMGTAVKNMTYNAGKSVTGGVASGITNRKINANGIRPEEIGEGKNKSGQAYGSSSDAANSNADVFTRAAKVDSVIKDKANDTNGIIATGSNIANRLGATGSRALGAMNNLGDMALGANTGNWGAVHQGAEQMGHDIQSLSSWASEKGVTGIEYGVSGLSGVYSQAKDNIKDGIADTKEQLDNNKSIGTNTKLDNIKTVASGTAKTAYNTIKSLPKGSIQGINKHRMQVASNKTRFRESFDGGLVGNINKNNLFIDSGGKITFNEGAFNINDTYENRARLSNNLSGKTKQELERVGVKFEKSIDDKSYTMRFSDGYEKFLNDNENNSYSDINNYNKKPSTLISNNLKNRLEN